MIVLVGGRMTLADGAVLDSRQPARKREDAQVLQRALTATEQWWSVVSSIVTPTLADPTGGSALVVGARSIRRATPDGDVRRSLLRKHLAGPVGLLSVVRSASLADGYQLVAKLDDDVLGIRATYPTPRWSMVDGEDHYLAMLVNHVGARIVVDQNGEALSSVGGAIDSLGRALSHVVPAKPPQLVIAPDTEFIRARVDALHAGRRPDGIALFAEAAEAPPRTAGAALHLPVATGDCSVSGWFLDGRWEDAGELEAARLLLMSRFDLRLGLWDLALNPILRATVLDATPVQPSPTEAMSVPAQAREHAQRGAEKAASKKEGVRRTLLRLRDEVARVSASRTPASRPRFAWEVDEFNRLILPFTEPLSNWPGASEYPLVMLRLEMNKTSMRVVAWSGGLGAELDLTAYVEERRAAFEAVAPLPVRLDQPGAERLSFWLATYEVGWGSAGADWADIAQSIAERSAQWEVLLAEFIKICCDVRSKRHDGAEL